MPWNQNLCRRSRGGCWRFDGSGGKITGGYICWATVIDGHSRLTLRGDRLSLCLSNAFECDLNAPEYPEEATRERLTTKRILGFHLGILCTALPPMYNNTSVN